jgi:integrase
MSTARRLRGLIELIIAGAITRKMHPGPNPALWRGTLSTVLQAPGRIHTVTHFKALSYRDVPAFMATLEAQPKYVGAFALRWLILNASRPKEAYEAGWAEIDREASVWTIPGDRMKEGKMHRVPLTNITLALLNEIEQFRNGPFLFPSDAKSGSSITVGAMRSVMERLQTTVTRHGFRSAFRDWVGDKTHFPREFAEMALAHAVGDATESSYWRSDALERRRELMQAWGAYVTGGADNVIDLAARRAG